MKKIIILLQDENSKLCSFEDQNTRTVKILQNFFKHQPASLLMFTPNEYPLTVRPL